MNERDLFSPSAYGCGYYVGDVLCDLQEPLRYCKRLLARLPAECIPEVLWALEIEQRRERPRKGHVRALQRWIREKGGSDGNA